MELVGLRDDVSLGETNLQTGHNTYSASAIQTKSAEHTIHDGKTMDPTSIASNVSCAPRNRSNTPGLTSTG